MYDDDRPMQAEDSRLSLMRKFLDVDAAVERASGDHAELTERLESMRKERAALKRDLLESIEPSKPARTEAETVKAYGDMGRAAMR